MPAFLATPLGKWVFRIVGSILLVLAIVGAFRLWLHQHNKAILKGYVLQSEKDASDAIVKKLQHDLYLGQQIREQADKAAEQLDIDFQKRQAADEKAISENRGGSVVTRDDIERINRVLNAQ
ncbi:hypothetical protein FHT87_005139 [Rhizobium sp. BK316]|uniref:hypothetical protein n=1 Tax=Rhizobium sp. BK316 TaxID=2587053 RepID=UPI0016161E40|nr:hypothetical protein [Rhizobium sp. BK316]MBB3411186.1 hypothetical protein [Rhizobium sp. BK316]